MAKQPQTPAPTGEWQLAEPDLLMMLGAFVLAWSGVESAIEAGIHKQTGLPPLESSIITAGLMFKSRASILSSLLHREPTKNARAITILKDIQNISDRNDILHGVTGGSKSRIWFNRRRTDVKFSSKIERYDLERLSGLCVQCADLSSELMRELDISEDEYLQFFQDSHNAANKP